VLRRWWVCVQLCWLGAWRSLLISRLTKEPLLDERCSYSLKQKPKTQR